MSNHPIDITQHLFSLRFVQGHRYLDRCGEALIRLEDALGREWLTTEATPTAGGIKSELLGIVIAFNSAGLNAHQTEYVDFERLRDAACSAKDILVDLFGIKRVLVPTARFIFQKGYESAEDLAEAEEFIRKLRLMTPSEELVNALGGAVGPLEYTVVTESEETWSDFPVRRRRRCHALVVRQERTQTIDMRIMQRVHLLPAHQHEVLSGMAKLKKRHPAVLPVAAQFDLEMSLESEFPANEFDLRLFLDEARVWADDVRGKVLLGPRQSGAVQK